MSAQAYFYQQKAQQLAKQCGMWAAARFLAKRDVPFEDALTLWRSLASRNAKERQHG